MRYNNIIFTNEEKYPLRIYNDVVTELQLQNDFLGGDIITLEVPKCTLLTDRGILKKLTNTHWIFIPVQEQ